MKHSAFILSLLLIFAVGPATADVSDPMDPFESTFKITTDEEGDKDKSAKQLVLEAIILLDDARLVDARTKLLRALQKDPKEYQAHMMLAGYYTEHVGHFRLALKYAKTAMQLFQEAQGDPPYLSAASQSTHKQLLYLMSQVRLNLDDYEGSLQVLDQFKSYGYDASWYRGSRAWVLMKLGRIEDAIRVAREGLLDGSEQGRTLNMLGILLSMHGEPENSLSVFREAIAYEFSSGSNGQPATPLNNSGEVYKEIFREQDAEKSWLRATSLPDGCEHVLPSLNLALLYIDQLNLPGAKRAMDSFEACVAQYPLRNGEEHKALVALTRGRIALHAGHVDEALNHLQDSMERRQWFGKIGTSLEDLEAALFMSIGQALLRKNSILATTSYDSTLARLGSLKERAINRVKAWWHMRRARRVLSEDLNDIEDLNIRNTDSLLEYPTLGELLAGYPKTLLERKLRHQESDDTRPQAKVFYDLYRAEKSIADGDTMDGISIILARLAQARTPQDNLQYVHAVSLLMSTLDPESAAYKAYAQKVLALSPAALRNYGLRLPVRLVGESPTLADALTKTAFYIEEEEKSPFSIEMGESGEAYTLRFRSEDPRVEERSAKGSTPAEAVNNLEAVVFSEELK